MKTVEQRVYGALIVVIAIVLYIMFLPIIIYDAVYMWRIRK